MSCALCCFFCVLWENPMRIFPPPSKMQDKSDLATPHFHKYLKLSVTPCYFTRLSLMITSRRSRDDYSTSRSSQRFVEFLAFRTSALGNRAKGWQIFQNGFAKIWFPTSIFWVTRPPKMRGETSKLENLGGGFKLVFFFAFLPGEMIQFHNGWFNHQTGKSWWTL